MKKEDLIREILPELRKEFTEWWLLYWGEQAKTRRNEKNTFPLFCDYLKKIGAKK